MENNLEHAMIETNGIRLHTVMAGPLDGPLVILLHGFPEFWWGWKYQIGPLSEAGFRVWAVDQRGYNRSDKPRHMEEYRLETCAKDIVGLIRTSGRNKVTVIGHDWGGIVAWWLGIHYPEIINRLVILNAPQPKVMARVLRRSPVQIFRSLYALFFQIPFLPEAVLRASDWKLAAEALQKTSLPGTFSSEDLDKYRQAWWQKGAMTAMLNWYRANFRRPPHLLQDGRVRVPTLILWGERDTALGRELVEPSLETCNDGRLVLFDQATHWVQHEEARRVNAALLDFLGPVLASAAPVDTTSREVL